MEVIAVSETDGIECVGNDFMMSCSISVFSGCRLVHQLQAEFLQNVLVAALASLD
jgi:hypothetical protein